MKLRYLYLTGAFLLISMNALADGPPIDKNGNITADHTVIVLDKDQLEQVGKYRILTLTDKQHEKFKKICDLFPKKMWVITPHRRLCTCEKIYGIWNKENQVGIPFYLLDYPCDLGRAFAENHSKLIEDTLNPDDSLTSSFWMPLVRDKSWCVTLTIDHQGKIYWFGRKIEIRDIEKKISESPKSIGRRQNSIFLSPPPSIDKETDERIKGLITRIKRSALEKDINVEIGLSH